MVNDCPLPDSHLSPTLREMRKSFRERRAARAKRAAGPAPGRQKREARLAEANPPDDAVDAGTGVCEV